VSAATSFPSSTILASLGGASGFERRDPIVTLQRSIQIRSAIEGRRRANVQPGATQQLGDAFAS